MTRQADELEQALQKHARGEPVEGRAASLVQVASRAGSLAETTPPPHGLAPGRQRFLAEALRLQQDRAVRRRPMVALRLAAATAALILLFGAVLGVGRASAGSLPGEPLHGLKLAAEWLRFQVAIQPQQQSSLAQAMAEERMDEIVALIEAEREVDASVSDRAARQLQEALVAAAHLDDLAAPLALQRLAEAIRQRVQAIHTAAGESPRPAIQKLLRTMERVREEAHEGEGDPDGLRRRLRLGTPAEPTSPPEPTGTPQSSRTPGPRSSQTAPGPLPSTAPGSPATPQRTGVPGASPLPSGTPHRTAAPGGTPLSTGGPRATQTPAPSSTPQPTGGSPASLTPGASTTPQPPHGTPSSGPGGTAAPVNRPAGTPAQTPGPGGGSGGNQP